MGNTTSICNLTSPAVADLLMKENSAFQPFAEKLFTGDGYLSLVDGNYLLSLNLDKPSDSEAFESILDTMNVSPAFVRKSLENLLRQAQQQSSAHHAPWQEEPQLHLPPTTTETSKEPPPAAGISSIIAAEKNPNTLDVQPSTAPPVAPKVLPRAGISSIEATEKNPKTPDVQPMTTPPVAPRRYAEVAATNTPAADMATAASKAPPPPAAAAPASRNEVQLFLAVPGNKTVLLGTMTLVNPSIQMEHRWKVLPKIVLEDYTTDAWARQVVSNVTIEATDDQGKNEIAGLVRDLGVNRKSVYGRFLTGGGSSKAVTGAMVISYLQSMKNKKGRLECLVEKDIRLIKDCPLEPLTLPESGPLLTALTPLPMKKASASPATTATITAGEKGTRAPSYAPTTDRPTESKDTRMPCSTEGPTPAGAPASPKRRQEEEDAERAATSTVSGNLSSAHAEDMSLLDNNEDEEAEMNDLDQLIQQAEGDIEGMMLSGRQDDVSGSGIAVDDDDVRQAIEELEAIMLSLGHSPNPDGDSKEDGEDDDDVDQAVEALEAMLASVGETGVPNGSSTGNDERPKNEVDGTRAPSLAARFASTTTISSAAAAPTIDRLSDSKGIRTPLSAEGSKLTTDLLTKPMGVKGTRTPSSMVASTPTKRPATSLQAAIAKDKHVAQTARGNMSKSQSDRPTELNGTGTPSSALSAAAAPSQLRRTVSPGSASAESAPQSSPSAQTSDTKSSTAGTSHSPTTVMLTPAAFVPARRSVGKKVDNQEDKVAEKQPLWWADACMEDDEAAPAAFPPARCSDGKKADASTASSLARYSVDKKVDAPAPARRLLETKAEKQDPFESMMVRFRQSLDNKLKKAFSTRSPAEDDRQQDFLEVSDIWNEQMKQEGLEKGFAQLSDGSKGSLVSIVHQAVHVYNQENHKGLVVRKSSQSMKLLSTLTIFENEAAAKRKASEFRKTKLCRYWPKGECTRGDDCPYAHGEHELVR